MNEIISKELLSEVYNFDVKDIRPLGTDDVTYEVRFNGLRKGYKYEIINIHELADKTIDFIEKKGYWISKTQQNIYRLIHKDFEVYTVNTDKRIDVPFMMSQWILENEISDENIS